jgi:hypothetical protein
MSAKSAKSSKIAKSAKSWRFLFLVLALTVFAAPTMVAAVPGDPRATFGSGGVARFTFSSLSPGTVRVGRIVTAPAGIVVLGSVAERLVRLRLTEAGAVDAAYPNGPLTLADGSVLTQAVFGPADAALRPGGGVTFTGYGFDVSTGLDNRAVIYLLDTAGRIEFGHESTIGLFVSSGGGFRPLTGAIAMQSAGRAVVIGTIPGSNGNRMILARHNDSAGLIGIGTDGTGLAELDPTAGVANRFGRAVTQQLDGRLVAVGVLSGTSLSVGRFTSDGAVDPSFAGDGTQTIALQGASVGGYVNVHVLPSGRVLVVANDRVTALTSAGVLDTAFATNGTLAPAGPIVHTAMSPAGDLYVLTASTVTAYTSAGQVNTAFGSGGVKTLQVSGATGMALHPGGDLLVGSVDATGPAIERIEALPISTLSIADASVIEGASGDRLVNVTVSLAPAASRTVSASWATAPMTAGAGSDYRTASGDVVFSPGQTTATIPMAVIGDSLGEPDESFRVSLTGATNAAIGDGTAVVTITNDDDRVPPVIAAKADVVAESKSTPVQVFYTSPTATDAKDGSVAVACTPKSGSSFPFGTTPVRCTATDKNGNTATSGFGVTVRLPTSLGAVTNPGNLDRDLATAAPNRRVRVTAGGFAPGSQVHLLLVTATGQALEMEITVASADGRIDVRPKIPHTAPSGPAEVQAIGTGAGGELIRAWAIVIRP